MNRSSCCKFDHWCHNPVRNGDSPEYGNQFSGGCQIAAAAILAGCSEFQEVSDKPTSYTIKGTVAPLNQQTKVVANDITADEIEFKWESGDAVAYQAGTEEEPILVKAVCTDPGNGLFELSDPTGLKISISP